MRIHTKRTRLATIVDIAADVVSWATDNGTTERTSATTFEPNRPLTRGEGVTMLHRFSQLEEEVESNTGEMHFELNSSAHAG